MLRRKLCVLVALIMLFSTSSALGTSVDTESGVIRIESHGFFSVASMLSLKNGNLLLSLCRPSDIQGEPMHAEDTYKTWLLCLAPDGSVLWEQIFGEEGGTSWLKLVCEREDGSVLGFFHFSIEQDMQYAELQRYSIKDGSLVWAGEKILVPEDAIESYIPVGDGYLHETVQNRWSSNLTTTYQMHDADSRVRWTVDGDDILGELGVLKDAFETPHGILLWGDTRSAFFDGIQARAALVSHDGQVIWRKKYIELENGLFLNGAVSSSGEIAMTGFMDKGRWNFFTVLDPENGEMRWHTTYNGEDIRYDQLAPTENGWLIAGNNLVGADRAVGFIEMDAQGDILKAWNIPFADEIECMMELFEWNDELWINALFLLDDDTIRIGVMQRVQQWMEMNEPPV